MTAYKCPETPEECDDVDSRGLLSHLANGHFGGDYDKAREVREETDLTPAEDAEPVDGEQDADDEPTDPDRDDDPESGGGAAAVEETDDAASVDHDPEPVDGEQHSADDGGGEEIGETTGAETDGGTDALSVGHEGREKLEPENAPGGSKTNIPTPDSVPDEVDADDLEASDDDPDRSRDHDPEPVDGEQDADDDGGLLGKIRGGSDRSSEEIVEDSDDPEERERKEELRNELTEAVEGGGETAPEPVDGEPEETTDRTAGGVRVDSSMVESVIGMPFNAASAATGFDGWELSAQERADNAELFVAVCEEHDVDLGPTVLLALSMGGTATSKAVQYKKWKESQSSESDDASREQSGSGGRDQTDAPDPGAAQDATQAPQREAVSDGGMNPDDPSTW